MTVSQIVTVILTGTVGTLGFTLLFRLRKRLIVWAVLGGCLTTALYVVCLHLFTHAFFQNLIPALFATVYAEVLARLTKSPTTPYIACAIIPLVPGGKLYYTMSYFVTGDMALFRAELNQTARTAAGLAVGIICISMIVYLINRVKFKKATAFSFPE